MVLGESRRVGEMLIPELGEEVHGLAILCYGRIDTTTASIATASGGVLLFLLAEHAGQVQIWSRADYILGEFNDVLPTCTTLAIPPVLHGKQNVVEAGENANDSAVVDHIFQFGDDPADIFAFVEEANALGIGHLRDDIESKALKPPAHVYGVYVAALVNTALGEFLEEHITDLIDVRLIVHDGRHAVHGIDIATVSRVTLGVPVREKGPLAVVRTTKRFVPVSLGKLMAASVDQLDGCGMLDAVAIGSVSHDGTYQGPSNALATNSSGVEGEIPKPCHLSRRLLI